MAFLGSNKTAKNKTVISNDNRTQDNKVAAENSNVITSAGGAISITSNSEGVPFSAIGSLLSSLSGGSAVGDSSFRREPGPSSSSGDDQVETPNTLLYVGAGFLALLLIGGAVLLARR